MILFLNSENKTSFTDHIMAGIRMITDGYVHSFYTSE